MYINTFIHILKHNYYWIKIETNFIFQYISEMCNNFYQQYNLL